MASGLLNSFAVLECHPSVLYSSQGLKHTPCHFHHGQMHLTPKRTFVLLLPDVRCSHGLHQQGVTTVVLYGACFSSPSTVLTSMFSIWSVSMTSSTSWILPNTEVVQRDIVLEVVTSWDFHKGLPVVMDLHQSSPISSCSRPRSVCLTSNRTTDEVKSTHTLHFMWETWPGWMTISGVYKVYKALQLQCHFLVLK